MTKIQFLGALAKRGASNSLILLEDQGKTSTFLRAMLLEPLYILLSSYILLEIFVLLESFGFFWNFL